MKSTNLILTSLILILGQFLGSAQTSLSCHHREYCKWNANTEKFVDCSGYDEASLFVVNDSETMLTHTIESMKSTYYVNERKYDSENEIWTYDVTSDIGNEYLYFFDLKNKEIRALFINDEGETMLLVFYVKAIF